MSDTDVLESLPMAEHPLFDGLYKIFGPDIHAAEKKVTEANPWDFGPSFDDLKWDEWTDISTPLPLGWQVALLTETVSMHIIAPKEAS